MDNPKLTSDQKYTLNFDISKNNLRRVYSRLDLHNILTKHGLLILYLIQRRCNQIKEMFKQFFFGYN